MTINLHAVNDFKSRRRPCVRPSGDQGRRCRPARSVAPRRRVRWPSAMAPSKYSSVQCGNSSGGPRGARLHLVPVSVTTARRGRCVWLRVCLDSTGVVSDAQMPTWSRMRRRPQKLARTWLCPSLSMTRRSIAWLASGPVSSSICRDDGLRLGQRGALALRDVARVPLFWPVLCHILNRHWDSDLLLSVVKSEPPQ